MIFIMVLTVYLIVGALEARKEREFIEGLTSELLEKLPIEVHKGFMISFAIVIILMLPLIRLWIFMIGIIDELKWLKTKMEIRKDLIKAKNKLAIMQDKLDERNKD